MARIAVIGSKFSGLEYEIGIQDLAYQPGLAFTDLSKPFVLKHSLSVHSPDSPGLHAFSSLRHELNLI